MDYQQSLRFNEAIDFATDYSGSFGFMLEMQQRVRTDKPMSPRQVDAILSCKANDQRFAARHADRSARVTVDVPGLTLENLPDGTFYAAADTDDGRTEFFRIDNIGDKPNSRWSDWIFVKRQYGDNFERVGAQRPGESYRGEYADLLSKIALDFEGAMQRFGRELGRCGHCRRTLTDGVSRERGIGPECWGRKLGH